MVYSIKYFVYLTTKYLVFATFCKNSLLPLVLFCCPIGGNNDQDEDEEEDVVDVDGTVNAELSCDINTLSNRTRECSRAR